MGFYILFVIIILMVMVFIYTIAYNKGYKEGVESVPTPCKHGHDNWDDCPVCGH